MNATVKPCEICGKKVTILNRDLATGLCADCARIQRQDQKDAENEAAEQRQQQQQRDSHGIPNVYPNGCPDCGGVLNAIAMFAREKMNLRQGYGVDAGVQYYSDASDEQGFFTGRHSISGRIRASMCTSCHRVFLHGEPEN